MTEERWGRLYYTDKALFEPISEEDRKELVEYSDKKYCIFNLVECLLFYNQPEIDTFISKRDAD